MHHLLDPLASELDDWLIRRAAGSFRARQIRHWVYRQRVGQFDEMSDLPKSLRGELANYFSIWTSQVISHGRDEDGTEKLLLQLHDGGRVECVLLRDAGRRTVCISTQVGCGMGCVFCASGLDGVDRNLSSGEMVEQLLLLQRLLPPEERLSHIVVMGMGEPLANLDRLLPALGVASDQDGLGISARRITISTVGLPAAIDRLADLACRYHLAVSLHAPDDQLRNELVPINRKIGLREILCASDRYFEVSGRRLTFEYVLLAQINDRPRHAQQLGRLLRGRPALVNLIPYNPVFGLPYQAPTSASVHRFRQTLEHEGINVKVRRRKGHKINAACGQLRRERQPRNNSGS